MNRRVALMTGLLPIGFYLGKGLSGPIKENLGFVWNFGFSMIVSVTTAFYVILFVPDSVAIHEKRLRMEARDSEVTDEASEKPKEQSTEKATLKVQLRRLFDLQNVKDGMR